MYRMGPRIRKKILILGSSVLFTIFTVQLTGLNTLRDDEESLRFINNALPSTNNKFRTFTLSKTDTKGNLPHVRNQGKEEIRLDSKDTRRTLQDIRTADDIKGHPRLRSAEEDTAQVRGIKNVTVAMTTRLQFESMFPSLLEEERCPLCYGTASCDQIYDGNISFHVGSVNLSEPHAIKGTWADQRIVGKRLVSKDTFLRFEKIICDQSEMERCDINAAATNSWMSKSSALNRVHKLHQDVYHSQIITLSATTCASADFFDELKQLYGVSRWRRGIASTEMAILTATMAINPEPALLKFFSTIPVFQPYFNEYLGECGRVILTKPSGKPLVNYLKASWEDRVDLSLKILGMIEHFHSASDKWLVLLLDFSYENFAVTSEGQLKVMNLGEMVIVDKDQTSTTPDMNPHLNNRTDLCNEDCLNTFVKQLQTEPDTYCREVPRHVEFMYMMACHSLLSDLITTKYERFFQPLDSPRKHHPGGLLHDSPFELDAMLSNLLYECVFEGQPGRRMHSVRVLKRLLTIIQRGFSYKDAVKAVSL